MTVIVTQPAIDIREVLSELHLDEELFESIRSALQPDSPIMTTPAVKDFISITGTAPKITFTDTDGAFGQYNELNNNGSTSVWFHLDAGGEAKANSLLPTFGISFSDPINFAYTMYTTEESFRWLSQDVIDQGATNTQDLGYFTIQIYDDDINPGIYGSDVLVLENRSQANNADVVLSMQTRTNGTTEFGDCQIKFGDASDISSGFFHYRHSTAGNNRMEWNVENTTRLQLWESGSFKLINETELIVENSSSWIELRDTDRTTSSAVANILTDANAGMKLDLDPSSTGDSTTDFTIDIDNVTRLTVNPTGTTIAGGLTIDTSTDQFTIGPDVFDALLAGVNIQPTDLVNTADGDTLLTVRSGGGSPRLFVQHSGRTGTSNTDFWVGTSSDMTGGNRVFHDAYHPNADTLTTGRTISLTGDVTGTSAAFDGSGNLSFATVVADDSHNHSSSSGGFTTNGTLTVGPTGSSQITTGNNQTRGKISVWTSSTFGIGMGTTYTHGGLSDYAMTFQMDNTANRGWWWGTTTHSNAQGAMSLTNTGRASISGGVRIGYGISDTTTPGATGLSINGDLAISGAVSGDAIATQSEAETGTNNDQLMTPLRTAQAITSQSSGSASAMTRLATASLAGDTTADFTAFDNATYETYMFILSNVVLAIDLAELYIRTSTDGGATFDGTTTSYITSEASGTAGFFELSNNQGSTSGEDGWSGTVWVYGAGTIERTRLKYDGFYISSSGSPVNVNRSGERDAATDTDALRFYASSGTLESGTITMYGIRNS